MSNSVPTESTPLTLEENKDSPETVTSEAKEADELEQPWPATYTRSISLLVGPKFDVDVVDEITKSPKITPLHSSRAKENLTNLKRGFRTPDPPRLPLDNETQSKRSSSFTLGLEKVHSLDFVSKFRPPVVAPSQPTFYQEQEPDYEATQQSDLIRKQLEAKAYRKKLLAQQPPQTTAKMKKKKGADEEKGSHLDSPGYAREKRTDEYRKMKKRKEEGVAKKRVDGGDSTFMQCVFNMVNVLMGVGLLGLPYIFKSSGWAGGFFVTICFGLITWRTAILIGRELNGDPRPCSFFDDSPFKSPTPPGSSPGARVRKPLRSFPDIAREAFGDSGCIALSLVLYFELFSCLSIFFVTLGDHLHTLFPWMSETNAQVGVAFLLAAPTVLLRTASLLSYLSVVGVFATVSVVVSVVISAVLEGDITEEFADKDVSVVGPAHELWRIQGLPVALGLIAFTFSGHAILPAIYTSMEKPQAFEPMITLSFATVVFSCLLVSVSGYYMFGTYVSDQVTISLFEAAGDSPGTDTAMTLLTWLMVLTAFSKFTLTMFPLALGMEEIFAPYILTNRAMEVVSSIIKIVLIILALVVAIFVPSFSFLCSLVGLICTMIVSCIFPAAAHLKLFQGQLSFMDWLLDWVFVLGGTVLAVFCTAATVSP